MENSRSGVSSRCRESKGEKRTSRSKWIPLGMAFEKDLKEWEVGWWPETMGQALQVEAADVREGTERVQGQEEAGVAAGPTVHQLPRWRQR